jgi:hypothetical protein
LPYTDAVKAIVIETVNYEQRSKRLLSEKEREAVRNTIAVHPEIHDVVPGLGGLRKARWSQESRRKGKRGGVRIIYFHALSAGIVALLDIYSKNEKEDLSDADKKALRQALDAIKPIINKKNYAKGPSNPGRIK